MADLQNAGYRLLSFTYTAVRTEKEGARPEAEGGDDTGATHQAQVEAGVDESPLPSLAPLMTSLEEIEASGEDKSREDASSHSSAAVASPTASSGEPMTPLTEFHLFGELPTELRLKIWKLTYLPRVVELRPTRPHYGTSHDDTRRPQWQSGCSNPAALSVSVEARECALEHFRIAFPLASITSDPERLDNPYARYAPGGSGMITFASSGGARDDGVSSASDLYNFSGPSADGKARLWRRALYIAPEDDTVCLLGQDSDFARLSHALRCFREADPRGLGISRLGLSVRGWGYGGSAVMMRGLGRTILRDLEQLVLFMYGEYQPPPEWKARGASTGGKELEAFRRLGNRCDLVSCEGSSAWSAYKVWSGGKGRQFWGDDGDVLKVGRNEIRVLDLEFREGW